MLKIFLTGIEPYGLKEMLVRRAETVGKKIKFVRVLTEDAKEFKCIDFAGVNSVGEMQVNAFIENAVRNT
jgi:hypothetical protein